MTDDCTLPMEAEVDAALAALEACPLPAHGEDPTVYLALQQTYWATLSAQREQIKLAWTRAQAVPPNAGLLTGGTVQWTGPGGAVSTEQDWAAAS